MTGIIALNSSGNDPEQNGFSWRVKPEKVEINGESSRGLCNGIYNFLEALGIAWPVPGKEKLPALSALNPRYIALSADFVNKASGFEGKNPAAAPWRRFLPARKETVNYILKKSEEFSMWALRQRYDALILPLSVFASAQTRGKLRALKKNLLDRGIALEAGGWDLSNLVPRSYFFLNRDLYRMEEGIRKKTHHFCPTSPGAIRLIGKEGRKLLKTAGDTRVIHLWPDRGTETLWCSCPSCRAFSPAEQNRIAVNTAADVLAVLNPGAMITYYEKSGEDAKIPMRKNLYKMEMLPDAEELSGQ